MSPTADQNILKYTRFSKSKWFNQIEDIWLHNIRFFLSILLLIMLIQQHDAVHYQYLINLVSKRWYFSVLSVWPVRPCVNIRYNQPDLVLKRL